MRSFKILTIALFLAVTPVGAENSSDPSPLGIPDVESIVRRADGRFDVTCIDGRKEVVTVAQIQAGDLCKAVDFFILNMGVYWSNRSDDPGRLVLPEYRDDGTLVGFVHHPIRTYSGVLCYDRSFVGRYSCSQNRCTTSYSTVYTIPGRNRLVRNSSLEFIFDQTAAIESLKWCN